MRRILPFLLLALPVWAVDDYATASDADLLARYQQLRAAELDATRQAVVENVVLEKNGATFRFKSGNLYLVQPVAGRTAGAVFVGEGTFTLKPTDEVERKQIRRFLNGASDLEEPFKEMVFLATDDTLEKLAAQMKVQAPGRPIRTRLGC